jgi:hypothetical protein
VAATLDPTYWGDKNFFKKFVPPLSVRYSLKKLAGFWPEINVQKDLFRVVNNFGRVTAQCRGF